MTFHAPTIIEKKREGQQLSPEEIAVFITRFTNGEISDGQMAALAMAIYFRGMNAVETAALTTAMLDSGERLTWTQFDPKPPVIDKHSTGGIGDKVSLVLAPLLACEGNWIPMISGRGLGITGGTLDKLESIPGFRTELSTDEIYKIVSEVGCVITGQTGSICPADNKLYALRDITGTVPSQALIVSSIMSKKLAESPDALVLDVKFGSGAFMKTRAAAESLGDAMAQVGNGLGVKTIFCLSAMDEPLGRTVGNALEVVEAISTLRGHGPEDLVNIVLDLATQITPTSRNQWESYLADGSAFAKFEHMVVAQGGDPAALNSLTDIHRAPFIAELKAEQAGVITQMDAEQIGRQALFLGAGRESAGDSVDHAVGFDQIAKIGESVRAGDTLLRVHSRTLEQLKEVAENLRTATVVS